MHQRNFLSLVRRIAGAGLGVFFFALAQPALAEKPTDKPAEEPSDGFRLISLLMPFLLSSPQPEPSVATPSQPTGITPPSLPEPGLSAPKEALITYELNSAPQLPGSIDLTSNPDNLWDRIRNGFAMPDLNDDLTLYYQQWYQARPDALRRMVERSRPFMHFIVEELEARGMPTELALLPMVESSFNPMAYSRANAAGLWQFIPATGKRFNLEQNWWQDKRRDIVASTGAALDYLQSIYEMHGDWHLALASYNWGEGAVKRAIEKNNQRGLPTDYANLSMPNETRHYVPKLQALKNIFGNPALTLQLRLPEILNRPYFATIDTARPMDVKTAARLANMPVDEFISLNPSHNRPVIKAETPLVLPADKLTVFRKNLEKNAGPLSEWQTYTLKHGEKLKKIAPRFGISAPELARVNSLSSNSRLGAGSTLLVPAGEGSNDLTSGSPFVTQINEAEPVCKKRCRQSAKGGKSTRGHGAHGTSRLSDRETRSSSKHTAKHADKVSKTRSSSRSTNGNSKAGKAAKSGRGRHG